MRVAIVVAVVCLSFAGLCAADKGEAAVRKPTHIPAQTLGEALKALAKTRELQVLYFSDTVRGLRTQGASGELTTDEAFTRLLSGTGLTYRYLDEKTVTIVPVSVPQAAVSGGGDWSEREISQAVPIRLSRSDTSDQGDPKGNQAEKSATGEAQSQDAEGTPEILVKGRRTVNADIRRTEDDAQPYMVFDRTQIERSMATNIEYLLRTRLPMNTVRGTNAQVSGANLFGNQSAINLRGLGTNQTLILVNGRRLAGVNTGGGDFGQPDINGIALSSIERIEVLPSTASGIYGGGATGGVINIVTRQDYAGIDVNVAYGNTFGSDAGSRRIDASAGFNLEEGRTQVMLTGSYSDSNPLLAGERDFAVRGRALQLRNNPATIMNANTPPFGYTPNIRSQNGQPLQLKAQYGGQSLNSPRTFVPVGYAGIASGGAPLLANAGQYNLNLPDDMNGLGQSVFNNPTIRSAVLNLRRTFGERVEAFIDANRVENAGRTYVAGLTSSVTLPASAPNNPFTGNIVVRFPSTGLALPLDAVSENTSVTGGVIVRLPRSWTAAADYMWTRSSIHATMALPALGDPDGAGPGISAATAFSTGVLNVMRDLNAFPLDFSPYMLPQPSYGFGPARAQLKQTNLRLSGPVYTLPGGPMMLSALAERRDANTEDAFEDLTDAATAGTSNSYIPGATQRVDAYYLEARVPLFSATNGLRFVHALELQASVRRDEYLTRAPSPNFELVPSRDGPLPDLTYSTNRITDLSYTFGLSYSPTADLAMRASLGTGFLPPGLDTILSSQNFASLNIADPKRGGALATVGPIPFTIGGNPGLQPEDSRSWSAGIILTPHGLPGLRASLDYTRIKKTNEIAEFTAQLLMDLESLFPDRVERAALTAGDAALSYTGGEVLSLDFSAENFASARLEAWDVQLDYGWQTAGEGRFDFYAAATWMPSFERQALPNEPFVDSVGFNNGQLEWRANAGLSWERAAWTFGWSAQFYDSYKSYTATALPGAIATTVLNQGSANIPAQLYHDLFARFRFDDAAGGMAGRLLGGAELAVGIQNVLDESPPILAITGATGGYSQYGDPRLRRYSISLRKAFGR